MFIESTSSTADQAGATFTVTRPNNGQDGKNLLLAFQVSVSAGLPATPSGWFLQDHISLGGGTFSLSCFYKLWNAEPATYTFDAGGMGTSSVWAISVAGAAPSPEQDTTNSGSGTTATATGFTTVNDGDLLFAAFTVATSVAITAPAGMNDLTTIGTTAILDVAYLALGAHGATGNKAATLGSSATWGALLTAAFSTGGSVGPSPPPPPPSITDLRTSINPLTGREYRPTDRLPSRRQGRRLGF